MAGEAECLPCFHGCDGTAMPAPGDMCLLCGIASLGQEPCVRLSSCGHVAHAGCLLRVLKTGWSGRSVWVDFGFLGCGACRARMVAADGGQGSTLREALLPLLALEEELKRKVALRVRAEGREGDPEIKDPASQFFNDPVGWGIKRFA